MLLLRILFIAYGSARVAYHVSAFTSRPALVGLRLSSHSRPRTTPVQTTTITCSPSRSPLSPRLPAALGESRSEDSGDSCWNPSLRKKIAAVSSLGILETAYLTYDKIQYSSSGGKASSLVEALCSADSGDSSCTDVLHGPYASLHLGGLDVPLSALGMAAYSVVFMLAALPLFSSENVVESEAEAVVDGGNRIALLGGTTLMASFSIYLVSLLVGVLHASCLFCFLSAGLSFSMALLSWLGGTLPNLEEGGSTYEEENGVLSEVINLRKQGAIVGASSVAASTVVALGLFLGVSTNDNFDTLTAPSSPYGGGTLLASTLSKSFQENVPPSITTKSSATALTLASDLKSLNARMFGAFWCSHCYEQKQALGYEAMQSLPYIECDREGYNNKRELCKEREVPGYPTWEIGGKLFPGERSLEELREIVDDVKSGR